MHFVFQTRGAVVVFEYVNYIYATEFCPAASDRYMAMCQEQQSPSQSRLPPFHHSAAKAAHALSISETDKLIHYS
jgi:hypothetical protein